jgi:hypothetical protein
MGAGYRGKFLGRKCGIRIAYNARSGPERGSRGKEVTDSDRMTF